MKTSEKIDPDNNLSSLGVHGSNRIICYKKKYQTHKDMIKKNLYLVQDHKNTHVYNWMSILHENMHVIKNVPHALNLMSIKHPRNLVYHIYIS